jgi:hypothetical protein
MKGVEGNGIAKVDFLYKRKGFVENGVALDFVQIVSHQSGGMRSGKTRKWVL